MSTKVEVLITPGLIQWAAGRARMPIERLAKKVNKSASKIEAWDQGKANPTLNQAQQIADALYIPLGYLFLPFPPKESLPFADFRTISGTPDQPSAALIDLIDAVLVKQDVYRELLKAERHPTLDFVGRFSLDDSTADVARDITTYLQVDEERKSTLGDWADYLRVLTRNAERCGVLVMKSGIVENNTHRPLSVKEFRGFAISDALAPLVFINGKDALTAQIFTLMHELTHIWLGTSGVSNENLKQASTGAVNDIERFCNAVAAEVLVPQKDFDSTWRKGLGIAENMHNNARRYRVSTIVILRRALDLHRLNWTEFIGHYRAEEQRFKESGRKTGGGKYFTNIISRNGSKLTTAIVNGALGGKILYRDAARILNTNVPNLQKLADKLGERRKIA